MPGEVTLADLAMEKWPGRLRSYKRGKILYWQGDPVENLYAI